MYNKKEKVAIVSTNAVNGVGKDNQVQRILDDEITLRKTEHKIDFTIASMLTCGKHYDPKNHQVLFCLFENLLCEYLSRRS